MIWVFKVWKEESAEILLSSTNKEPMLPVWKMRSQGYENDNAERYVIVNMSLIIPRIAYYAVPLFIVAAVFHSWLAAILGILFLLFDAAFYSGLLISLALQRKIKRLGFPGSFRLITPSKFIEENLGVLE